LDNSGSAALAHAIVSSEAEELVLVDYRDAEIGHSTKARCHDAAGLLHRAFSLFVFNQDGHLLLQQRSAEKRLWPQYWANSCCSHPRRGETMDEAVHRRLRQELGITSKLEFLYKFVYHASYGSTGSEYEYCWVYCGTTADDVQANGNEVADWRYLSPDTLDTELLHRPELYTPWLKSEWARIRTEFNHCMT